jgi:hypothetical protein
MVRVSLPGFDRAGMESRPTDGSSGGRRHVGAFIDDMLAAGFVGTVQD